MSVWSAEYKCRRCGKKFTTVSTGNYGIMLKNTVSTMVGAKTGDPLQPDMFTMHSCDGDLETGSCGIADFIGWEVSEE